jgi:hypothetical protein
MSVDALTELEQLLREEREAVRKLDGARILEFAQRKEALVDGLRKRSGGVLSPEDAARLRSLTPMLRHNSVLLAHARDILRDALKAARLEMGPGPKEPTRGAAPPTATPRLLSVRG